MDDKRIIFKFDTLDKGQWIYDISNYISQDIDKSCQILIDFDKKINAEEIQPLHLVTLACLIEHFSKSHSIFLTHNHEDIKELLMEKLRYAEYWNGKLNHVDSTENKIFNLWRIVESEKDLYSKHVEDYFRKIMKGRDLSVISLSMIEAYYNIFDHAYAKGNAFSLIKYNEDKNIVSIAICDMGIGIVNSVKQFCPEIKDDIEALKKAIEIDFTVGSKEHNKGKGLDNILSAANNIRIYSKNALLVKVNDTNIKFFKTKYCFNGTLIYFDIMLNLTEEEEIVEELIW